MCQVLRSASTRIRVAFLASCEMARCRPQLHNFTVRFSVPFGPHSEEGYRAFVDGARDSVAEFMVITEHKRRSSLFSSNRKWN